MARTSMSPPWDVLYREINAMFANDPEVTVLYDEEKNELSLFVSDDAKAAALMEIIPSEKVFGNVTMKINVVPANTGFKPEAVSHSLVDAFTGNSAVSFIKKIKLPGDAQVVFVVFEKEVVQYWTDNLADLYGITSTLYQDIAKDIFEVPVGVYFCTDVEDYAVGTPLGEWP